MAHIDIMLVDNTQLQNMVKIYILHKSNVLMVFKIVQEAKIPAPGTCFSAGGGNEGFGKYGVGNGLA